MQFVRAVHEILIDCVRQMFDLRLRYGKDGAAVSNEDQTMRALDHEQQRHLQALAPYPRDLHCLLGSAC